MGDHHGVDVGHLVPGPADPIDEVIPRFRAGKTGIDHGDATLVLQHVAVDVSEPGHADRQLRPEDSGRHFGDVGGRVLLLLFRLARRVEYVG